MPELAEQGLVVVRLLAEMNQLWAEALLKPDRESQGHFYQAKVLMPLDSHLELQHQGSKIATLEAWYASFENAHYMLLQPQHPARCKSHCEDLVRYLVAD